MKNVSGRHQHLLLSIANDSLCSKKVHAVAELKFFCLFFFVFVFFNFLVFLWDLRQTVTCPIYKFAGK